MRSPVDHSRRKVTHGCPFSLLRVPLTVPAPRGLPPDLDLCSGAEKGVQGSPHPVRAGVSGPCWTFAPLRRDSHVSSFHADNWPVSHWPLLLLDPPGPQGKLCALGAGSGSCAQQLWECVGVAGRGHQAAPSGAGIRICFSANCLFLTWQVSG